VLIFVLVLLQGQSWSEERVIEEKFSCGPIKITVVSKIEPVNSTKEILKNAFLVTEQIIIIDNKKIKVGPSLEEYWNKISWNFKIDKDEKVRSLYERYKDYPLYQISGVNCFYDTKKNYYAEVSYGRYCNGAHCEYNELYTQNGKLLISDKQRIYLAYTDLNKMNKAISQYLNFKKRKLKPIKKQKEYSGVFDFVPLAGVSVEDPDRVIEFMTDKDFK
jgi:hypothetical protein